MRRPASLDGMGAPLVILVNSGTPVLTRSRPQVAKVVMFASMCIILAIVVALVAPMLRR